MTPQKSAGNVLLNAIALPLWTAIDKRWNRYCVSSGSLVTSEIRFPSSWTNSTACIFQECNNIYNNNIIINIIFFLDPRYLESRGLKAYTKNSRNDH